MSSTPVSADEERHRRELAAARRRVTNAASIGLLLLRLGSGALLFVHGLQHAKDIDGLTAQVRSADVPFSVPDAVAAWVMAVGELGLGILLAVGFLTRVAGVLVAVLMGLVYASWYVPHGHLLTLSAPVGVPGENVLGMGLVGLVLLFTGPGRLAVDAGFRRGRGSAGDTDRGDSAGSSGRRAAPALGRSRPASGGRTGGSATGGAPTAGSTAAGSAPAAGRGRSGRDRPLPDDPTQWTAEDIERL